MKIVGHDDEIAKQMVRKFCDQVFWLRVVHNIYKELFEDEEARILTERTAPSFFGHLNTVLHYYLLLEFVKITDPATSMGQEQENFTIDNLIESIVWPKDVSQKLKSLNEKTKTFRKYTKMARDKLLAHMDKKIFLSGKILGEFPEGEDERFLKTLEEICDITHEVCFNRIFGYMSVVEPGDVVSLKRALKNSLAFIRLLSESKGDEKAKLYSYLQEKIPKTSPNNGTNGES
jgi:hypothetical protein